MKESLYRRYALLVGCFVFSLYLIAPTLWRFDAVKNAIPKPNIFLSDGLNLGLDLQGGLHLTMQVMVEEAIVKSAESRAASMDVELKNAGITLKNRPEVALSGGVALTHFAFNSTAERDRARQILDEKFGDAALELSGTDGLDLRSNLAVSQNLRASAVDRAMEILRGRIDQFGVAEPVLIREGVDRIVIQLPGLKDPERAMKLIGTTAQLEFRIVHDANSSLGSIVAEARRSGSLPEDATEEQYKTALQGKIPNDATLAFMQPIKDTRFSEGQNAADIKIPVQPILLRSKIEMTGEAVVDAGVNRDPQTNEPNVQVSLSPASARDFGRLTSDNVNHQLAIVLDGKVKSAPNIHEPIPGGQVRISGQFTDVEAADLAVVLRSGALPAPIKVIQNITVGATLGEDSIRAGFSAGLLGLILVVFFMAWYYRLGGVIADGALMLNNIMLMGSLAALDATLTLPGIAGIVLSMGMAVDSNVLLFERMRDELELGRPASAAIRGGFEKAFWTIFDSHVTTLLTGIVLFMFGTGPIKGFAITLCIGVALNLFTALVGTRVIYDHLLMNSAIRRIQFRQIMRRPNIDFIRMRGPAFAFSGISVVLAIIALVQIQRGEANLGIDFAGGTMITMSSDKPIPTAMAREALAKGGFEEAEVQSSENTGHLLIRVKEADEETASQAVAGADHPEAQNQKQQALRNKILAAYQQAMPDSKFNIEGVESISAAVSQDLRDASLFAVIISLIGIIGYLSLRFDFRFGVAASLATFHDVFFVLAVFFVTGQQINLLFVTALLTVAGYSLTDTVVVFDRLREVRHRFPTMEIGQVINTSVNDVLSRTIITSTTTLLTLVALILFGGTVLFDFSLAMFLGVLIGTYSSVFVASPILYEWEKRFGRLVEEKDEPRTFQDSTEENVNPSAST